MNEKLISVIVPCYNISKYLHNFFKSIENAKYKNLEIIMVNDGSTDDTYKIISDYCKDKTNYKVVTTQINGGISDARNSGLKCVTGEYITFIDPDDIIFPNYFTTLYNNMTQNNAEISICSFKKIKDNVALTYDNCKFKSGKSKLFFFDKYDGLEQYLSQNLFDFCVWNKMYLAKIIKDNNLTFNNKIRYGEDTLFNYSYFKHVNKVVFTTEKLHYYVQRKTSLVHNKFSESRLGAYSNLNEIVRNSEAELPEVINYAHSIRAMVACEMLYFIKTSKYNSVENIQEIIRLLKIDVKYLKYAKRISAYRRLLIPLVPFVAKLLLKRRLKKGNADAELLEYFK